MTRERIRLDNNNRRLPLPPVSILDRVERLGIEQLEMLNEVLKKAISEIDPDEILEEHITTLLDQIDLPSPPTTQEVLAALPEVQLQTIAQAGPTPNDKYLAQAELLARTGQLQAPTTTNQWPIDYAAVQAWRARETLLLQTDPAYAAQRKAYYASGLEGCIDFINHWGMTHEPRNAGKHDAQGKPLPTWLPMILFKRQEELIRFTFALMETEANGLVEKSRDMGATWTLLQVSIWMWLFWDAVTVGWGSATAVKLDRSGDLGSIFEKLRTAIKLIPEPFFPNALRKDKHLLDKRAANPNSGSAIVGEVGDEIGRGSRTRLYVVDEAAHLEHPELVESALSETTRVRIDVSSVSGLGTVFHRTRMGGVVWEPGQVITRGKTNVFIMDWRHHPAKSHEWYKEREEFFKSKGLEHVFAQEIDRDYSAAVQGTIIPKPWLEACVDAHHKIEGFDASGGWVGGFDVADAGLDTNAVVKRKGWVIKYADQWGERDTAVTTRRALNGCLDTLPILLSYDSIGVGSGVKGEANRLKDDNQFPVGITLVPWNAGGAVQQPGRRLIEGDKGSPKNKDFFANLKAQGWWSLRTRVYKTFRAITAGDKCDIDELISFDSVAIGNKLYKLIEEIAQPTIAPNTRMKMQIDKQPEGMASPNLGDACMMCCFPMRDRAMDDMQALASPLLVNASKSCIQCSSTDTLPVNVNGYRCLACGYIGDRDETKQPGALRPTSSQSTVRTVIGGFNSIR